MGEYVFFVFLILIGIPIVVLVWAAVISLCKAMWVEFWK